MGDGYALLSPGEELVQSLDLASGQVDVSLQYQSPVDLEVSVGRVTTTLPASLTPRGLYWRVAALEGDDRREVRVRMDDARAGALNRYAQVGAVAATGLQASARDRLFLACLAADLR
jgi:hypothetical protein